MVGEFRQTSDRILRNRFASDVQLEFDDVAVRLVLEVGGIGLVDARRPEEAIRFVEISVTVGVGGIVVLRSSEGDEDALDAAEGLAKCVEIWPLTALTPGRMLSVVLELEKLNCRPLVRILW